MGKRLNLIEPKGFNEKLMWLNLFWQEPLKSKCADKYLVREYVINKSCGEILNPIYGVYDRPEDIKWGELPQKFVLKSTFGSGNNLICLDKNKMSIRDVNKELERWLKPRILNHTVQLHYSQKTNKILCEKYIESPQGVAPNDYKFYCFNGEPRVILAFKERDKGIPKRMFYDLEWNKLDKYANREFTSGEIEKPLKLNEMIECARKLSEGFPFVRVDLYNVGEQVIFGELTFTPAACLSKAHNEEGDKFLGSLLELPDIGISNSPRRKKMHNAKNTKVKSFG